MAKEDKAKEMNREKSETDGGRAILFELEHIAVESREALYEIVKNAMESRGSEFNIPAFSRYCLEKKPKSFVPELLAAYGMKKRSAEKFINEIEQGVEDFWERGDLKCREGVAEFLEETGKRGFAQVAITALPQNLAVDVINRLGLESEHIEVHSFPSEDKSVAGADIWMQAAMDRDINLGLCTALVTSSRACKATLTADLNCIVIPDRFSAFQDFGGAFIIVDKLSDLDVDEMITTFYQKEES